jgi:hypothetical protein
MSRDAIPPKDTDFNNWVVPFNAYIALNGTAVGVADADKMALNLAVNAWTPAYAATQNPATAGPAATGTKNTARAALEAVLHPLIKQIQANPAVTDDMRTAMGLHISDGTHTRAAVPATSPQLTVRNGLHLEHIIDFKDAATPTSKAKPAGVKACRIYFKIGGPVPADASAMAILDMPTHTPYIAHFTGAQAGQTVYYLACWVNTHNESGPWSDLVSATIAA